MSWTETAFPQRMLNDPELTGQIATFQGQPAVFSYLFIPPTDPPLVKPYIITEGDAAYVPQDFKGTEMADGMREIRVYGLKKYGVDPVKAVAQRIRNLFRSATLAAGEVMFPNAPINLINCKAIGPLFAPVEGAYVGRLVRVMFKLEELE